MTFSLFVYKPCRSSECACLHGNFRQLTVDKQTTYATEEPGSSENQFSLVMYINVQIIWKLLLEIEEYIL